MLKPKREPAPENVDACYRSLAAGMLKPKPEPAPAKANVDACSPPPAAGKSISSCILKQKPEPASKNVAACSSSIAAGMLKPKPEPAPAKANVDACSPPPAAGKSISSCILKQKPEPALKDVAACSSPIAAGMLKPKPEPAPAKANVDACSPPPAAGKSISSCILKQKPEPALKNVAACSSPIASGNLKPKPELETENIDACASPIAAGSKPHLLYTCLLKQHAQKVRKPPPVYRIQNEGFDHLPKFRATVCFDGTSYTSLNTFQHCKMAETDVSKLAYLAILQKSKNEAFQIIQEDKILCKSIVAEYANKMHIEIPKYETIQLQTELPTFRSSVIFNGVTYTGDSSKSKKEAEQLGARAVIMKLLDSEFGNDIVEIIICKSRHFVDMSKVQEIKNVDNGTNTSQASQHITVTCQTSKRNRKQKNKRKCKKKMHVDAQMPTGGAVPTSQALPC